jgi:hypothetical protein
MTPLAKPKADVDHIVGDHKYFLSDLLKKKKKNHWVKRTLLNTCNQ